MAKSKRFFFIGSAAVAVAAILAIGITVRGADSVPVRALSPDDIYPYRVGPPRAVTCALKNGVLTIRERDAVATVYADRITSPEPFKYQFHGGYHIHIVQPWGSGGLTWEENYEGQDARITIDEIAYRDHTRANTVNIYCIGPMHSRRPGIETYLPGNIGTTITIAR